jgi:hypothetical protein
LLSIIALSPSLSFSLSISPLSQSLSLAQVMPSFTDQGRKEKDGGKTGEGEQGGEGEE